MKKKKMNQQLERDTNKACVVLLAWIIVLGLACVFNTSTAWLIFGFLTVILLVYAYFDNKLEQLEKSRQRYIQHNKDEWKALE